MKYTVIGYDIGEADIWIIRVEAKDPGEAAALALAQAKVGAEDEDDVIVSCVFAGHHEDVLDHRVADILND